MELEYGTKQVFSNLWIHMDFFRQMDKIIYGWIPVRVPVPLLLAGGL